ncbi:MAG: hypothetical protein DRP42_00325 [Tenericutes bacterium]|nr:MAG: hypothetical protein DRP42_00325 [Mycoplasmatota bacterium]
MAGDISLDKLADMDLQLAIILGSEGKGVSQKLSENADFKLSIKMTDKVESLNVSATAAIISHNLMKK